MNLLESALTYFEQNQPVIAVGKDKTPYRRGWNQYFVQPQTEDEVKEQFSNGVWGIAKILYPGSDDIHLDFDGKHAEEAWFNTGIVLPETARIKTPSGGFHLVFKVSNLLKTTPSLKRAVRLVEAVCTCKKSCGADLLLRGYAIVPPSPGYHEDKDFPLECAVKIPDKVIGLALAKQRKSKSILGDIPDGRRNTTLLRIAGALLNQGKDHDEILERLFRANEAQCKPPLEREKVENIAASITRYRNDSTEKEDEKEFNPVTALQLLREKIPPISWVWEQYIPEGSLTLLVGYMKTGKSTLAYPLAVSVAHGAEFMTRETKQGGVLILAVEEHKRDVRDRLLRFGMTEADPIYVHAGKLTGTPEIIDDIKKFIVENRIVLVIIDSLSRFWNVQNENDNMEVIREVSPILDLAHETNTAILPLYHERKSGGDDGRSIRGGSALFGLADQAIFLERQPGKKTNKRVLKTLGRYDSPDELIIELVDDGYEVLGRPEDIAAERMVKVRGALTEEPQDAETIAAKVDLPELAVRAMLERLKEDKEATRTGAGRKNSPFRYHVHSFPIERYLKRNEL